ncbi:hypothetical protein L227DRAFT_405474 [Lentinus tigrinus ALCF2SS1-6]|uniref:Uncharacterized protein n=1 Tax=Lentinus tigrinus ALCF2SS1-6 TaxID=1328759 RepID=A0A5C2RSS1_9APHY|nr:hypothetical protein L227DRAFT_405474 [Lentinus tigrinus ALCF2SS1-6]
MISPDRTRITASSLGNHGYGLCFLRSFPWPLYSHWHARRQLYVLVMFRSSLIIADILCNRYFLTLSLLILQLGGPGDFFLTMAQTAQTRASTTLFATGDLSKLLRVDRVLTASPAPYWVWPFKNWIPAYQAQKGRIYQHERFRRPKKAVMSSGRDQRKLCARITHSSWTT